MGSALATLGLLGSCHWDNDEDFQLTRIATYLWADSMMYYLPTQSGTPLFLQKARAMAADGYTVGALSGDGTTLSYYSPASTQPSHTFALPAPCQALSPRPECSGFLVGGTAGLWEVSEDHRLKALRTTPTLALLPHTSFLLSQNSATTLTAHTPQSPHLLIATLSLPGPLQTWWIATPTTAAGTFHYQDTLYTFTYEGPQRLFTLDTTQPVSFRQKAASPYLTPRWGIEYTGTLTLSPQGLLTPLNLDQIVCFAADFLGGYVYYVRSDTLWEKNLHTGQTSLRAASFRAGQMKVVGVYAQGRAKITSR